MRASATYQIILLCRWSFNNISFQPQRHSNTILCIQSVCVFVLVRKIKYTHFRKRVNPFSSKQLSCVYAKNAKDICAEFTEFRKENYISHSFQYTSLKFSPSIINRLQKIIWQIIVLEN